MTSVFDAASQKRRKSKAKSGEGISKAMASLVRSNFQDQPAIVLQVDDDVQGRNSKAKLMRSSSEGLVSLIRDARPVSRATESAGRKRSMLHRVESADVICEPTLPLRVPNEILEQNKAALSKMVMAGMRLHGLQQRRKPLEVDTHLLQANHMSQSELTDHPIGDDEYKLIYHQTLKSALFACRAHCHERLIPQESMRDLVDKLLAIFCADPLQASGSGLIQTPAFKSTGQEAQNPFDAPSSSTARAETNVWNTPVHKRRKRLDLLDHY